MEKIVFPELEQARYEEKQKQKEREEQLRIDNLHLDHVVGKLGPFLDSLLHLYERHVKAQEKIANALDENL